jgi:hypothetical protein
MEHFKRNMITIITTVKSGEKKQKKREMKKKHYHAYATNEKDDAALFRLCKSVPIQQKRKFFNLSAQKRSARPKQQLAKFGSGESVIMQRSDEQNEAINGLVYIFMTNVHAIK